MSITLWQFYVDEARRIGERSLRGIDSPAQWQAERPERRRQFLAAMGLDPLPERCDLRATTYGSFAGEGFRAETVAYQLFPDVWCTGNLYRPDPLPAGQLPAVLYLSGHRRIGVLGYQRHAALWAQRGYACLITDTIEQHDNPGDHHQTFRGDRYDFISRGYTAAGGELWSSIRALDLLLSLPEVDPARVGTTGISGGGALSFFLTAADERICAVSTVAGVYTIADLLADRGLECHCDCIFPLNLHGQDSPDFAALIAPRPLQFCFAMEDRLYNPQGIHRLWEKTRDIYRLYGAEEQCALFTYPGPHMYQPETITAINGWFDRYVAGEARPDRPLPETELPERVVTVFNGLPPEPNRLDLLPELMTRQGSLPLPRTAEEWAGTWEEALGALRARVLHWLDRPEKGLQVDTVGEWRTADGDYLVYRGSNGGMEAWAELLLPDAGKHTWVIGVADRGEQLLQVRLRLEGRQTGYGYGAIEPRGAGLAGYDPRNAVSIIRAGIAVGLTQTLLWIEDISEMLRFFRTLPAGQDARMMLYGRGDAAVACLYAAILDERVAGVVLEDLPASHAQGGHLPAVLGVLDIPQALGLLAPRPVGLVNPRAPLATWPERLYGRLGCPERFITGNTLKGVLDAVVGRQS
ncbi:MAG: alpha/beta hydrolase family protein [Armatimonadota bacterium]